MTKNNVNVLLCVNIATLQQYGTRQTGIESEKVIACGTTVISATNAMITRTTVYCFILLYPFIVHPLGQKKKVPINNFQFYGCQEMVTVILLPSSIRVAICAIQYTVYFLVLTVCCMLFWTFTLLHLMHVLSQWLSNVTTTLLCCYIRKGCLHWIIQCKLGVISHSKSK